MLQLRLITYLFSLCSKHFWPLLRPFFALHQHLLIQELSLITALDLLINQEVAIQQLVVTMFVGNEQ